jgi:hypothetical protein
MMWIVFSSYYSDYGMKKFEQFEDAKKYFDEQQDDGHHVLAEVKEMKG